MTKTLDTGEEKIQKISNLLRKETLEPAKKEVERIIQEAKEYAEKIIHEAHKRAEVVLADTRKKIEQDRKVFHSALIQASKLAVESLKQGIEKELFHQELGKTLQQQTSDPNLIANLLQSMIAAIEKEGLATEISALIPSSASIEAVNALMGEKLMQRLKEKSVVLGDFGGGVQLKLHDKQIILEVTDVMLKDLLASYVRKDFRKMIFQG